MFCSVSLPTPQSGAWISRLRFVWCLHSGCCTLQLQALDGKLGTEGNAQSKASSKSARLDKLRSRQGELRVHVHSSSCLSLYQVPRLGSRSAQTSTGGGEAKIRSPRKIQGTYCINLRIFVSIPEFQAQYDAILQSQEQDKYEVVGFMRVDRQEVLGQGHG